MFVCFTTERCSRAHSPLRTCIRVFIRYGHFECAARVRVRFLFNSRERGAIPETGRVVWRIASQYSPGCVTRAYFPVYNAPSKYTRVHGQESVCFVLISLSLKKKIAIYDKNNIVVIDTSCRAYVHHVMYHRPQGFDFGSYLRTTATDRAKTTWNSLEVSHRTNLRASYRWRVWIFFAFGHFAIGRRLFALSSVELVYTKFVKNTHECILQYHRGSGLVALKIVRITA